MAQLAWHDWFPAVWLDEHQMGSERAAHLRDAGDRSDQPERAPADLPLERASSASRRPRRSRRPARTASSTTRPTRTSGRARMAWSGWWHNQIGLLTEVASVRIAAPIDQLRAAGATASARPTRDRGDGRRAFDSAPLLPPTDITAAHRVSAAVAGRPLDAARHRRLRAHRDDGAARDGGGPARNAAAADLRGQSADGRRGPKRRRPRRSSIPVDGQHDPREAAHLVERLHDRRRRGVPRRRGVRGRRQGVRGRHVRHPDDAGLRALREGPARAADLSRGAAVARARRRSRRTTSPPGRSACSSASTSSS